MSLGYAEKLSYREDLGGQLGAPELHDEDAAVQAKVKQLAQLVRQAKRIVAFTGAGISTACGIPDFRGPSGIWTLQRAGKPLPRPRVGFAHARPSVTHQALLALAQSGKLTYLVSQNVDGLHLRSGLARGSIAELHGNCFAERCKRCRTEYIRDFEIETVGFKRTGRKCSQPGCGGHLVDHILDWEDELPQDELELAQQHAAEADLAICLGTSLQITPACNLPLRTTRLYKALPEKTEPGKLVIVNLQRTQHDNKAERSGGLVIHARCDEVMRALMRELGTPLPQYRRTDAVLVGHLQHPAAAAGRPARRSSSAEAPMDCSEGSDCAAAAAGAATGIKTEEQGQRPGRQPDASSSGANGDCSGANGGSGGGGVPFTIYVRSRHGPKCPMPMVDRVEIAFPGSNLAPAALSAPPFELRRTAPAQGPLQVALTLHLHETADADKREVQLSYCADLQPPLPSAGKRRRGGNSSNGGGGNGGGSAGSGSQEQLVEFETQTVDYEAGGGTTAVAEAAAEAPADVKMLGQEEDGSEAAEDGECSRSPTDAKRLRQGA